MDWDAILARHRKGEPLNYLIDEFEAAERKRFRAFLSAKVGPEALANYDRLTRNIDLGITHARNVWHSISPAQRRALNNAAQHGGRVERIGKEYRHGARNQPYRPIHVATIRNLCDRDLMAWDGGAFDPEAGAVVTERGTFVLAHGQSGRTDDQ